MGDSFVWGWGVADQERFTQILEAAYPQKSETLNYGISGHGPTQYLLQFQALYFHMTRTSFLLASASAAIWWTQPSLWTDAGLPLL